MKINLAQLVKTLEGQDFAYDSGKRNTDGSPIFETKPTTLGATLFGALIGHVDSDRTLDLQGKLKVHKLASKVKHAEGVTDFTAEEVVMLKDRASKTYGIHLLGQVVELLEGSAEDPPPPPTEKLNG